MNRLRLATAIAGTMAVSAASSALAAFIDDFSSDTSGSYIQSNILDQNATVDTSLDIAGGVARVTKTAGTEAEQNLYLRGDHTLDVGETLLVDYAVAAPGGGNRDFGIAVATTDDPVDVVWTGGTVSTRQGYATVYVKPSTLEVASIAFDTGGSNLGSGSGGTGFDLSTLTGLYISRPDTLTLDVGYITAAGPTSVRTYTVDSAAFGFAVGFYSDIRATETIGDLDNLRIVPEPATSLLVALGLASLGWRRQRA